MGENGHRRSFPTMPRSLARNRGHRRDCGRSSAEVRDRDRDRGLSAAEVRDRDRGLNALARPKCDQPYRCAAKHGYSLQAWFTTRGHFAAALRPFCDRFGHSSPRPNRGTVLALRPACRQNSHQFSNFPSLHCIVPARVLRFARQLLEDRPEIGFLAHLSCDIDLNPEGTLIILSNKSW